MTVSDKATNQAEPFAISAQDVAKRYSVTTNTIHVWSKIGAMPYACRINGALRWKLSDLREWEAGDFARRLRSAEAVRA